MIIRPRWFRDKKGKDKLLPTDSSMALYENLARQRILPLYGPVIPGYAGGAMRIDQFSAQSVVDGMWVLARESSDPIWLIIDTPGGSVDHGMMIFDMMQLVEAPVYTVCRSALSMGAVLLAGGEPGHRYVFPHGKAMLHQVQTRTAGSVSQEEFEISVAETKRQADEIVQALMQCGVPRTREEIYQDIRATNWMNPNEIIEYGLADHILKPGAFGPIGGH